MTRATILIVEDNEMNMQLAEYLLEEAGFAVLKASSGEEALELTGRVVPDLILMDLHLPVLDGLSVVRRLKSEERTSRIPILALTAHAMRGDRERFLEAGCDGYISKPIDVKTFVDAVRAHLAAHVTDP